jgi:3-methyladenine DNA glycosylase AlkD
MPSDIQQLRKDLKSKASKAKAEVARKFFKTGIGQYGHGDKFIGVTVPEQRAISKNYLHLTIKEIGALLDSPIHEERLTALLVLVAQYKNADSKKRHDIFKFYLKKAERVNNWDLVDLSAYHIVGAHITDDDYKILLKLARSKNLWKRRIAMVATFKHICDGKSEPTFQLAQILFKDPEELMHKAAGWMLREVGKRVSRDKMEDFLCRNYQKMPRIMLRYAIEHLPPARRKAYLDAEI